MRSFKGWPGNRRAAISLSFDDSVLSHLQNAFPVLQRWGLRGTFYVLPGEGSLFEEHLDGWRALSENGHELGNHTLSHPCSRRHDFTPPERALEGWTLQQIEADIDAATQRLRELIPGLGSMSFAYPCGESFVGEGPTASFLCALSGPPFCGRSSRRQHRQRPTHLRPPPAAFVAGHRRECRRHDRHDPAHS